MVDGIQIPLLYCRVKNSYSSVSIISQKNRYVHLHVEMYKAILISHILGAWFVSWMADYFINVVHRYEGHNVRLIHIAIDECCHFALASIMWSSILVVIHRPHLTWSRAETGMFVMNYKLKLFLKDIFFAGLLGVALDLDHFIIAAGSRGSVSLDAATTLSHRPFGHCIEAIIGFCLVTYVTTGKNIYYTTLVACSLFTNQLRDSIRRGLWFWTFGSTPPLSGFVYMLVYTCIILMVSRLQEDKLQLELASRLYNSVYINESSHSYHIV